MVGIAEHDFPRRKAAEPPMAQDSRHENGSDQETQPDNQQGQVASVLLQQGFENEYGHPNQDEDHYPPPGLCALGTLR